MSIYFSKSHEWAEVCGKKAKVGITDFAQHELGDIVYISLPEVGATINAGEMLCDVESVKAVSEIYSPVTGVVTAVNQALENEPGLINSDAMSAWICEMDIDTLPALLTEKEYEKLING